ncbi:hypothetical protein AMAG_05242 [Allomyces macrogynus ATCC 38327]|uniref:Photolyase/cryptochrome alpha/beta domain-containing protein n=1 Tax=Allomyces macrogynus (strain ATCC 38327) TaxID=578462 RepID=A0A0L0SB33_ALLM3|nr:hypothetical protein AMAG_05242 [Allomyces macrogynus ATCC 38327]|eukprot:KNE59778.1 hypothetical protein AMAG_05242 [Allomyces macrogynus ATCC 38327]
MPPATTNLARNVLMWFRRDLRLHDNPALLSALGQPDRIPAAQHLYPVYCLEIPTKKKCGHRRWIFLLECLHDLDANLRKLGSRLFVVRGLAPDVLPLLVQHWNVSELAVGECHEPFAVARDNDVAQQIAPHGCDFKSFPGRTLFRPQDVLARTGNGKAPLTMAAFSKIAERLPVPTPVDAPASLPSLGDDAITALRNALDPATFDALAGPQGDFSVPTIEPDGTVPELHLTTPIPAHEQSPHRGGETEALRRLDAYLSDHARVTQFEKPKTSPAAFYPNADTTILSPYTTYGALSVRTFRAGIDRVYRAAKGKHSKPPVSLLAQLYWREFFMTAGATTLNFEQMRRNPICLQTEWKCIPGETTRESHPDDYAMLDAWAEGQTGYPWIDAIMVQLRREGWVHHLARHSVACFLTRGDLYISWERGAEVFEDLLLDHEWALNRGNWMWLSASAFFHQYFRVYSPVKWGQSWDSEGVFIRKYLPVLRKMPKQYIYEPWKAPIAVQRAAGCVVGVDYPKRIVDHDVVVKVNMTKMKTSHAAQREQAAMENGDSNGGRNGTRERSGNMRDRPL